MHNFELVYKEDMIDQTAKDFLSITKANKHLAFYGEMGVGKTTFIKALCRILETLDLVSSPTFAIINEYSTKKGKSVYHFDFYRIKTPVELLDIGFYDYCTNEAYCFIEWPEKAEEIIPEDFIHIALELLNDGSRKITFAL
jgi:tRNA threonylcarbamoyladenosine biosynthesis protein TsaE